MHPKVLKHKFGNLSYLLDLILLLVSCTLEQRGQVLLLCRELF
jgi:hypothetical protein